ncbi:YHS domain-containing (seleno)protein [Pedobacter aquatilis]|uniref:YHS domain-containing (seleno)protein n=1 Tax=Pedobacter aquatilis TaxID=351343 RepID=UPI0025B511E3|nr:YHS domain-containing (seleno)protein [Pedobacter aquatilis]MDN3585965.1 YHS domain-containing (seleno)protein [Pedobacter aquatilis]
MKKSILILMILSVAFSGATLAQTTSERKKEFNIDKVSLAIEGYDPVAYFSIGKAVEGKKEISVTNNGIAYRFSTNQNKELFKANPSKYEPQYGGWCAYAMGETGEKVEVDPETFKILDGKLYLFYNKFFNNTKKSWNKDEKNLKAKADASWAKFLK